MNMPKENRYLLIMGGVLGVLCLLLIAGEVLFIHESFRNLNNDVFQNKLAIQDLQRKAGIPAPGSTPPASQDQVAPRKSDLEQYVVHDALIKLVNDDYFKTQVQRSGGYTNFTVPYDGGNVQSFGISNSIVDRYQAKEVEWSIYETTGFVLTLRDPSDENDPLLTLYTRMNWRYPKPATIEWTCDSYAPGIRMAAAFWAPVDHEICDEISVYDTKGGLVTLPKTAEGTDGSYLYVYDPGIEASQRLGQLHQVKMMRMGNTPKVEPISQLMLQVDMYRYGDEPVSKETKDRLNQLSRTIVQDLAKTLDTEFPCGMGECY